MINKTNSNIKSKRQKAKDSKNLEKKENRLDSLAHVKGVGQIAEICLSQVGAA